VLQYLSTAKFSFHLSWKMCLLFLQKKYPEIRHIDIELSWRSRRPWTLCVKSERSPPKWAGQKSRHWFIVVSPAFSSSVICWRHCDRKSSSSCGAVQQLLSFSCVQYKYVMWPHKYFYGWGGVIQLICFWVLTLGEISSVYYLEKCQYSMK